MMYIRLISVILLVSFSFLIINPKATAQETTCPELVLGAYNLTQVVCAEIGDDEACYGNLRVTVQPDDLAFREPGDLTDVVVIESLHLSSMNEAHSEWGISLMHLEVLASEAETPQTLELVLFGNVEIKNVAGEDADYSPMQAFTFQTGVADRPCDEAPDSGILIQTPEGVGEITLLINEVIIELGSTAFLQAEPDNEMLINIVEGQANVTAQGTTITVPAGAIARVPLDANGLADGAPEGPEPYDETALQTLPIPLLTDQVAIAPAIIGDGGSSEGGNGSGVSQGLRPLPGEWSTTYCGTEGLTSTVSDDATSIEVLDGYDGTVNVFEEFEPSMYLWTTWIVGGESFNMSDDGSVLLFTSVIDSRMEAVWTLDFLVAEGCQLIFTR